MGEVIKSIYSEIFRGFPQSSQTDAAFEARLLPLYKLVCLRDVRPCSLVDVNRRFGDTYYTAYKGNTFLQTLSKKKLRGLSPWGNYTEPLALDGEVSANSLRLERLSRGQLNVSPRPYSGLSRPEATVNNKTKCGLKYILRFWNNFQMRTESVFPSDCFYCRSLVDNNIKDAGRKQYIYCVIICMTRICC
jgi:hypothetical protein